MNTAVYLHSVLHVNSCNKDNELISELYLISVHSALFQAEKLSRQNDLLKCVPKKPVDHTMISIKAQPTGIVLFILVGLSSRVFRHHLRWDYSFSTY